MYRKNVKLLNVKIRAEAKMADVHWKKRRLIDAEARGEKLDAFYL